ncbi:MAG: hypothetical protein ACK4RK_00700 [Gemmataceae bacterium]
MNPTVAAVLLTGGLIASSGCLGPRCGCPHESCGPGPNPAVKRGPRTCLHLKDPCWPERYNYKARHLVCRPFVVQARNGHVLTQTLWNYHFESPRRNEKGEWVEGWKLTEGGKDYLLSLLRRRPCPDTCLYLATAQDIVYDPDHPEQFAEDRCEIDARRMQEMQKYLAAQSAGRHLEFQIVVHDPAEVGLPSGPMNRSIQAWYGNFQGVAVPVPPLNTVGVGGTTQ